MKTYFTINNRRYEAKEFDLNTVCDLEEMGFSIVKGDYDKKPIALTRAYIALCMDAEKDVAGAEWEEDFTIEKLNEIQEVMRKNIEEAGFFQELGKETEKNTPAESKEAKKEK